MTFLSKKTIRTPLFKNTKEEPPNFLLKLYTILDTPEYSDVIQWDSTGQLVIMKKIKAFTEKVLPLHYKHSNYSSFVRQLNMYDFHKKKNSDNEEVFYHSVFVRGNKEVIQSIKRKSIQKKGRQRVNGIHSQGNWNENEEENINERDAEAQDIDIENYVIGKKATKVSIENTLSVLIKKVHYFKERQQFANSKIDNLKEKNDNSLKSNRQTLKEFVCKTDYKTKLEAIIIFLIEVLLKKHPMKQTQGLNEPSSRKNSDALKPQSTSLKHNEKGLESSIASLFSFLNFKPTNYVSLNQLIAKSNSMKLTNDYLMRPSQPLQEYHNMLLGNSPIKANIPQEDSVLSNETSSNKNNSLFSVGKLSLMNNGLLESCNTNINRIGEEDSSNFNIQSKTVFDFDSEDCIINTVNDINFNH